MSDYRTLQRWISDGESVRLDFKTSITSPAKIAKNLVAFANCRGGKIVVGIEDKGFFVGVDLEGEKYSLNKSAKDFCFPAIDLTFDTIQHQGKLALIGNVQESRDKPHLAWNKKKTDKQIYIRVADSCIVAPKSIADMLQKGEMNFSYRTGDYHKTKRSLTEYLRANEQVDIPTFAQLYKLSEHNAQRMLVDFLFEGILKFKSQNNLIFALA